MNTCTVIRDHSHFHGMPCHVVAAAIRDNKVICAVRVNHPALWNWTHEVSLDSLVPAVNPDAIKDLLSR